MTGDEKESQIARLEEFHLRNRETATLALAGLHRTVLVGANVFDGLMSAARECSLGQITDLFFEVGGGYRRGV